MANELLTTDLVTREAVRRFNNEMVMLAKVDRQFEDKFSKVGDTIRIRQPLYFEATDGATISSLDDLTEGSTSLQLSFRKKVAFKVTSQDLTLDIEDFSERYIAPAMRELVQKVELEIANTYKQIYNFVGTPGSEPSTFLDVGAAKAKLDELGVPIRDVKHAFYNPTAAVNLANSLNAVFPQQIATMAIEEAMITKYAGFEIITAQTIKSHTAGTQGGTPLINGASQNVTYAATKDTGTQTLNVDGWTASVTDVLREGDVFTIAGVNSVNRHSREDTGDLAQFVVRANADSNGSGETALTISPAIIIDGAYQTVTAEPADGAAVTVVTGASDAVHKQNMAWHRNAITVAMAPLDIPPGSVDSSRQTMDNISIRTVVFYNGTDDESTWRFDILFGVKAQNPGFAIRTTS